MRLIIFGSNGMLGTYLNSYLVSKYEILSLTRSDLDLSSDESTIMEFLYNTVNKNDIIINAAGVIKQRDFDILDMIKINSSFPHYLSKAKNKIGCKVIHITTDCVFNGERGEYTEEDLHDCLDDYGKSKSLGEGLSVCNIRTSIIGEERTNKKSLLEWVRSNSGKVIDGYNNHLWNGVTCLELSKFIDSMIKENLFWEGTKHIFSPDTLSKYKLISIINDVYDLGITINEKSTDNKCHRDLSTINEKFIYKTLSDQILEMEKFELK